MTGAEIAMISIASVGMATSIGSAVYSGLEQSEMAERQNQAIEDAKKRANRNVDIRTNQHKNNRDLLTKTALRKADYAALQESAARSIARGQAKAALSAGGRVASAGTSTLALLEQIEMKSEWKQHLIAKGAAMQIDQANMGYAANMLGTVQSYEEQWYNLDNQMTNAFAAGLGGGLGAFGGGLSMTAGGMSIAGAFEGTGDNSGGGDVG
tara:strand:+ start:235 stop:864 length:630 start_codon:yes stop_codon:yes gene_type:complete